MFFMIFSMVLISLIFILFFTLSKSMKLEYYLNSSFECGFTSYFFSRFSFSIHYFLLGLTFLFLDLELCFIMPLFNLSISMIKVLMFLNIFMLIVLMGLLIEWKEGNLDWIY